MKTTVLHEILAVEQDRERDAAQALERTLNSFTNQTHLFQGLHSVYEPFDAESLEGEEKRQALTHTVAGVLGTMAAPFCRAVDVTATKDVTNQSEGARAPIIVDGVQMTQPLPATTLLMLESRLKTLGVVLSAIPTLAEGREWVLDAAKGQDVYRDANVRTGFKNKKVINHKILVEATTHHPAQVEKWSEDERVGKTTETTWSGMVTPADKALILHRLSRLQAATKQARMRANMAEVTQVEVAESLMNFLLDGVEVV